MTTDAGPHPSGGADSASLLRLLHLASPALPIGAYAYSQGLEYAVSAGWVRDEATAADWILGLLRCGAGALDAPVLLRLHRAWSIRAEPAIERWNGFLHASRGAIELQREDAHLGGALARLLASLGVAGAELWLSRPTVTYANMFALAAAAWKISEKNAVFGYLFAWAENQIMSASRLVPLGQTESQRILARAIGAIPAVFERASSLGDDEIGWLSTGQAIASALHETQYTRLCRS